MNNKTLQGAAALAVIAGGYLYLNRERPTAPPVDMNQMGETTDNGIIIEKKTIDWRAVVSSALVDKAAFLTTTQTETMVRNRQLETSIKYTPFPASTAVVRVTYDAEYPIGYVLKPGTFSVSGGEQGLVITLRRPELIARPSVKLQTWKVIESGILIDEKAALLELQQLMQPEAEKRAAAILQRPDVIPRSEKALRAFLQPLLQQQAGTAAPPPIKFVYR